MVNRRTARLDLLALTFVVFLTLSKGFDTTTGRHVSRTAVYEIQRVHWKTETKNQRATADLQVYHPQRSAPVKSTLKRKSLKSKLLAKANKLGTNTTITIDLNGPNVCGNRCCTGWTAALKTKKCTKPRCFPRCQNGAICRHPNTCVCRRGFHGSRCELAAVTHAPTIEVHPRPTSTPATPVTTPARLWTNGAGAWASRIPPTSAPRPSSTAGPTSAPRPSSTAGPSSTSRPSSIASPSSTSGPTSAPRPSSTAGPTSAPRPSSTAGPSSTSRPSSIASPSSAPRPSSTAGPSSAPRPSSTAGPSFAPRPSSTLKPGPKTQQALRWLPLTLREAQSVLLKKALANRGQGEKMTSLLLKHVEAEREKLHSLLGTQTSSVKTIHTQRGQYTIHVIATPADNQTAGGGRGGGGGGGGGGGRGLRGAERIKVLFTPTVCKVRCTQDRCTNFCERGNVTTLYSSGEQGGPLVPGPGFRVFLCPLLCRNGGVCIQKDRCLCPPNFTGKFCHIPVTGSSTNDIEKPPPGPSVAANQAVLRHSEFILPLQSQSHPQASASGTSMVKVRVQHPPEATVKIHQVVKVGYGPTVREQSETVTWSAGLSGTRNTVQPGQRAEAPPPQVQAQTIRGDSVYTESSGFKYCFREVRNGQCSSPLPGLRSQETCCRGAGLAWGINECTLCPSKTANSANGERSCPSGFERNGTQCVDINECLQPGFCENGNCVNTRGSHSCVCRTGYLLDASHGICVSQKVISEDKGQCYRIVSQGTCTLPILRNITKQICCCSRVGKAWGRSCEKCPYFGSDGFKEICPAGPGYQYSASANNFHQRAQEQLGTAGASLTPQSRPQLPSSAGSHTAQSRPQLPSSAGSHTAQSRPQLPSSAGSHTAQSRPQLPSSAGSHTAQSRPQLPSSAGSHTAQSRPQLPSSTGSHTAQSRPQQPAGSAQEAAILPQQTGATRSDGQPIRPLPVPATPRPAPPRPALRACEADPRICGSGRCVNLPDGKHTCVCNPGYQLNAQQGRCQDVDECRRTPPPCDRGQCQNTDGGYRCTCPTGYRSGPLGTSCIDVNECVQTPRLCSPGQCQNTPGSFRCACPAGFQSSPQQTQCLDVDECRQAPSLCANGRCENTLGSYRCACSTGYKLQGNTCADINECESPLQCPGQECVNSQGSYRCVACQPGFDLLNRKCSDIDECRKTPSPCASGRCENTPGSYRCVCPTGYRLQGSTCTDINECEDRSQCPGQECVNSQGSYRCVTCKPGFRLLNRKCSDIDECQQAPSPCASNGRCENTLGSYRCVCSTGYKLQGNTCTDIDECQRTRSLCANGRCENTLGSYRCACSTGYKLQANTCTDVNECEDPLRCPGQECVNSPGSYRCVVCRPGFSLLNSKCADVDECHQTRNPCANGRCENTLGSYRCACSTGYKLQGNTCADIDECRQSPVPCANGRCENTPGSYRCACSTGYKLQGNTCTDIDECRQAPNACANGRCENTLGSYRCACSTGYKLQGNTCTDIDECRQTPNVCANGRCENTLGSYRCACSTGYKLQGSTCTDVDECRQTPNVCANGRCENTLGSYRCACSTGYKLQGNTCTDVDECENALQCPGQECFNSQGSFSCSACKPGFSLQNRKCQDVDECQRFPPPCANGRCHNSPGSYRCECLSGFRLQNNTCTDVDECEDPLQCPGQECVNSEGSYICIPCRVGYTMQNRKCSDVDECRNPRTCSRESRCVNTDGSYRCECNAGFRASGPGRQCRDINECVEGDVCSPRGACVNSEGSYHCVCSEGYQPAANGTRCVDVDECARPGVCQDGRCANTVGSFQCQCREGFAPNPERTACLDVDECAELGGTVCRGQRCENSIGSYHCITTCEPGYQLTGSGVCVDINECANKTVCGEHAFCQNLIGTYHCMCDQGYEATSDDRGCVDENECVTMQGVCGAARCENVEGSFLCECPGEDEEFDLRTARCRGRPRPGHPMFPGSSSSSSSSSSISEPESQPRPDSSVRLPPPRPGEARECYHSTREQGSCNTISRNTTHQECCCTIGEAWGLDCQFSPCPTPGSAEYQELCPSGKGYVTTGPGAFSYRDVDECKVFDPQVCKSGVCVNHIPGYSCYCTTGYYYDTVLLECIDNNECERGDSCEGGLCINTVGSYFCSCEPPLVLDDTQRRCINSTSLTVDENLAFCWQHVTASLVCQSPLLEGQVTFTECCCLYGEAWGLQCALCPARDSDDYEALCSVLRTPVYTPPFTGRGYGPSRGPTPGRGYGLPYDPESYPEPLPPGPDYFRPGYDDYPPPGGRRPGYGGIPVDPYGVREPPYSQPGAGRYYEEDFDPRFVPSESDLRPPFRIVDPLTEPAYGARPRPPSRGDPRSLSLAPLPENYEEDEDEDEQGPSEPWRSFLPREAPPYPDFSEGRLSDGLRRDTYERRYESYEGLGAEDCGILHGCENGRCIRVAEGYTCDCYDGYHLDMTSMTCIDINECEEADDLAAECVNGQCVNTDGSYRCLCLRGFIMSRRPNHCIRSRP
ncbi:latent-transforming growth factor beta-binding protein 4 isoform X10 [Anguilla rostrata]|uniref:latent-transforming growth factor beta-binding protein 4 isoform X10 n=1 Tax=Anguilla rostrata TaxID=7938 RepID=UPI0030CC023B